MYLNCYITTGIGLRPSSGKRRKTGVKQVYKTKIFYTPKLESKYVMFGILHYTLHYLTDPHLTPHF